MKTYEDLVQVQDNQKALEEFILAAIVEHKSSALYRDAVIADEYFRRKNTTITQYQKLLYTLSGEAVPDNFSANFKMVSGFFQHFVIQENLHLLGNGVTFNEDNTKERLGGDDFDNVLIRLGEYALIGGVAFGFFNLDHVEYFKITEFVPLIGEEDGALRAGIRFWQIDAAKPLRVTLYQEDGYTDYIYRKDKAEVLFNKRAYKQIVKTSVADGTEIYDGENYNGFPIAPLWGNLERQSELTGLRSNIDAYDLIKSGFANDLDDASQIYWTIQNAGGMDDVDLAKFVERMKTVRAAVVDEQGSTAEAHTIEVPYAARTALLDRLRSDLFEDAMALDTKDISSGNITATAIEAAYDNLTLKCDRYEMCVTEFIKRLLELIGIDDSPTYKRSRIVNVAEDTQTILSAAQYLDDETILKHLPFLNPDEIDTIMQNRMREEAERYENNGFSEERNGQEIGGNGEGNQENLSPIER